MDGIVELSAEEEALYDMSDDEFEAALSEAKSTEAYDESGDTDLQSGDNLDENDIDNTDGSNTDGGDADNNGIDGEQLDEDGNPITNSDELDENGKPIGSDTDTKTEEEQKLIDEEKAKQDKIDEDAKKLEQSTTDSNTDGKDDKVDEPAKDADNSEPGDVKPQTHKYKANGQDFEFTDEEMKAQFGQVFGQAMNYTQKMQELKPWRTTISAMEDNKLTHEDVELLISAKAGDMGAINKLMEQSGVNPMDLDAESAEQMYQPKQYGSSELEIEINDIVKDIGRDPEYATTQDVLSNRWDQQSRDAFLDNPSLIRKLHTDVKSGDFDVLNNQALKMKTLDGARLSDIEYYAQAAKQRSQVNVGAETARLAQVEADRQAKEIADKAIADAATAEQARIDSVKAQQVQQKSVEDEAEARKAATITSKASGKKGVVDYLDEDDKDFDEWYDKLQASQ